MTTCPTTNSPNSSIKQGAPVWSWKAWSISSLVCFGFTLLTSFQTRGPFSQWTAIDFIICVFTGFFTGTFFYIIWLGIAHLIYRSVERQIQSRDLTEKTQSLQEDLGKDFFTNLVRINFKYLDKYYLQTQAQSDKSFFLCLGASIVGLAIIAAGVVLMFLNKTNPAYITTAAGALSEFIAAVFFYLYNKTIVSMGEYHQKLVITQNIALALKVAEQLPEGDRPDSLALLIEALTKDVNHILSGQKNL